MLANGVDGKIIGDVKCRTILRNLNDYIDEISTHIAKLQTPLYLNNAIIIGFCVSIFGITLPRNVLR